MRKRGKVSFLTQLDPNSSVLDVGCGLHSSFNLKNLISFFYKIDSSFQANITLFKTPIGNYF